MPTFQRNILSLSSELKFSPEDGDIIAYLSETLAYVSIQDVKPQNNIVIFTAVKTLKLAKDIECISSASAFGR
jgi:hypothetical protein